MASGAARYVRYSDAVEAPAPDKAETIQRIIAVQRRLMEKVAARDGSGHLVRAGHAKSHGLLKGELRVMDNLPPELTQGLFAAPRAYPVLARMANVPSEVITDRVATQRGLSLKVLGVEGEMLPGHAGETTQDFALDSGKRFANPDAASFLRTITAIEATANVPVAAKVAFSAANRTANQVLHAVGRDSAALDFFGHPSRHPLAESYYTQAAIRYGDHVARLGVVPVSRGLDSLPDLDPARDGDALRTATVAYFARHPAEFDVVVQLCTDLDRMPVEDSSADWDEEESPYRSVARLRFPVQDACSPARQTYVDERLAFCPAHGLAAHRGLGSIMRARLAAYPVLADWRRRRNGVEPVEPRSLSEVPD
jgi:hypothetical protein